MRGWIPLATVLALAFAACGGSRKAPAGEARDAVRGHDAAVAATPSTPRPCAIAIDERGFAVDGAHVDVASPDRTDGGAAAIAMPVRTSVTMVAAAGGGQLWRVDCRRDPAVALIVAAPDARVESGRMLPDGKTYLYGGAGGVWAVDLDDGRARQVYATPRKPLDTWTPCYALSKRAGQQEEHLVSDGFRDLADDGRTLIVDRTAPYCHVPSVFEMRVTDWADPAKVAEHPSRPIRAITAGSDRRLWMTDGNGLWRSDDRGDTWKSIAVSPPLGNAIMADFGVGIAASVLVDRAHPKWLVVRTSVVQGVGDDGSLGYLARSRDGGRTWTLVAGPGTERGHAAPDVAWLVAIDGDTKHLIIGVEDPELLGDAENDALSNDARPLSAWSSSDGGAHWTRSAQPAPSAGLSRLLTLGDDRFAATEDGLYRTRDDHTARVTPELTKPFAGDVY